jgi:hypothetical protein
LTSARSDGYPADLPGDALTGADIQLSFAGEPASGTTDRAVYLEPNT